MAAAPRTLDTQAALKQIDAAWDASILETLKKYIEIPNQSPGFDSEWETNGHQDRALDLLVAWIKSQNMPGLELEVLREKGRTPLVYLTIPSTSQTNETVLMYGHFDKQPPMTEYWTEGTGPWKPVIKDGKLYGRGGADDGYSCFAALNALQVLHAQGLPHARIVVLIEFCEESGSRDLPYYLEKKKKEVGEPSLVICLDSGCSNYEQLWMTTSLRGMVVGTLRVDVLTEAVHSGMASGIVPSSFRIMRQLLDRIEDAKTGKLPDICYAPISAAQQAAAKAVGEVVGDALYTKFPFVKGAGPVSKDYAEVALGGSLMPALSYVGADGLPSTATAGNVLRSHTSLKLSLRLPPSIDAKAVAKFLEKELTRDPPYGARVTFETDKAQSGWMAPELKPWLSDSLQKASQAFYKKPGLFMGEGGSIPFMGMLGEQLPRASFVITGVLGPSSNAHGPNEFLHIDFCKRLTGCVASILTDHHNALCTSSSSSK